MPNYVSHRGSRVLLLTLLGATAMASCNDTIAQTEESDGRVPAEVEPFAVVELFTSEGCSSCPPADRVLADLAGGARENGRRVFALSFHVDYWDRLGWKDPYSEAAHSRRQSRYASAFGADHVYTPQMIVNGTTEFLGSDRQRAEAEIKGAMGREPESKLTLRASRDGRKVSVAYAVMPVPRNAVLNVALVERGLTNKVRRGENRGRTLAHENVVRAFVTEAVSDDGRGAVDIALPADASEENTSVVVYAQDGKTLSVLGAAGVGLPDAKTPDSPPRKR